MNNTIFAGDKYKLDNQIFKYKSFRIGCQQVACPSPSGSTFRMIAKRQTTLQRIKLQLSHSNLFVKYFISYHFKIEICPRLTVSY